MIPTGTCQISFAGNTRKAVIALDLPEARINVRFADDSSSLGFLTRPRAESYIVDKINVRLANGEIRNGRITNLIPLEWKSSSAQDNSDLITSLALPPNENAGQTVLSLSPKRSLVRLPIDGFSRRELVFGLNRLHLQGAHIRFRVAGRNVVLSRSSRTSLVLHGNAALLPRRTTIERALGLAQGGRIIYRAGVAGKTIELNFIPDDSVKPLGRTYADDNQLAEFLERYIAYEQSLSAEALRQFRLAMAYLIDGLAGLPSLEQKVISLFIAIEILDNTRTLSKQAIARLLSIREDEGKLLKDIRNSVVHEGLALYGSVLKARQASRRHARLRNLPFRVTGLPKTRGAANCHFYLASKLLAAIALRVGMTEPPDSYLHIYR